MGGELSLNSKNMVENIKKRNNATEDNREVALGICFGTGAGIIAGALVGNIMLGLSAGGVLGVVIGAITGEIKKYKKA
jgi:uncharacterized membrane protein